MKKNSNRITIDPNRMNGEPCIRDLRLTVRRVLEALAIYPDRNELKREYPELEDEDIRQALAFAAALLDDKVLPLPASRWGCCSIKVCPARPSLRSVPAAVAAGWRRCERCGHPRVRPRAGPDRRHPGCWLSRAASRIPRRRAISDSYSYRRAAWKDLADLLAEVLKACAKHLADGAMISVSDAGIRVRRIPLLR